MRAGRGDLGRAGREGEGAVGTIGLLGAPDAGAWFVTGAHGAQDNQHLSPLDVPLVT